MLLFLISYSSYEDCTTSEAVKDAIVLQLTKMNVSVSVKVV